MLTRHGGRGSLSIRKAEHLPRETESRLCLLEAERKGFYRASPFTPPCCFFNRRSFVSSTFITRSSVFVFARFDSLSCKRTISHVSIAGWIASLRYFSSLACKSDNIPAFHSLFIGDCGASWARLRLPASPFVQPIGFFRSGAVLPLQSDLSPQRGQRLSFFLCTVAVIKTTSLAVGLHEAFKSIL